MVEDSNMQATKHLIPNYVKEIYLKVVVYTVESMAETDLLGSRVLDFRP